MRQRFILLHGTLLTADSLIAVADVLAAHGHDIVIERVGVEASLKAECVRVFRHYQALQSSQTLATWFVGHSLGAILALNLAHLFKHELGHATTDSSYRVGLVLLAGNGRAMTEANGALRSSQLNTLEKMPAFSAAFSAQSSTESASLLAQFGAAALTVAGISLTSAAGLAALAQAKITPPIRFRHQTHYAVLRPDIITQAADNTFGDMPILAISAELDVLCSPQHGEEIAQLSRISQHICLPQATHFFPMTHASLVAASILEFAAQN